MRQRARARDPHRMFDLGLGGASCTSAKWRVLVIGRIGAVYVEFCLGYL